jgi:hypothetical protein
VHLLLTMHQRTRKTKTTAPATTVHVTRSMTTDAARQAVLGTTELLEHILVHLPVKDLFIIQRVCKRFLDFINTSVALQHKLFLRTSSPKLEKTWQLIVTHWPSLLELALGLPSAYRFAHKGQAPSTSEPIVRSFAPVKLNPYFRERSGFDLASRKSNLARGLRERAEISINFLSEGGSWRSMYLTDPSCQVAKVQFNWKFTGVPGFFAKSLLRITRDLKDEKGLTFGKLLDDGFMEAETFFGSWDPLFGNGSIKEVLKGLKRKGYKEAQVHFWDIVVELQDVVCPSEEEFKEIEGKNKAA